MRCDVADVGAIAFMLIGAIMQATHLREDVCVRILVCEVIIACLNGVSPCTIVCEGCDAVHEERTSFPS